MKPSAEAKARALAEAVLQECADLDNPCYDAEGCGCAESLALAFLAALDAEPPAPAHALAEPISGADLREWARSAEQRTFNCVRISNEDALWLADQLDQLAALRAKERI